MDNLKPSQLIVLISGVLLLIFSFFDIVEDGESAWGEFGVYTWPAILGIVVAGALAATIFGQVQLPEPVLTFSAKQLLAVLAIAAAVIQVFALLSILLFSAPDGFDAPSPAFGAWLATLAAIGLAVGAVMELQDTSPSTQAGPATPPSPF